jgi:hypothetical protein
MAYGLWPIACGLWPVASDPAQGGLLARHAVASGLWTMAYKTVKTTCPPVMLWPMPYSLLPMAHAPRCQDDHHLLHQQYLFRQEACNQCKARDEAWMWVLTAARCRPPARPPCRSRCPRPRAPGPGPAKTPKTTRSARRAMARCPRRTAHGPLPVAQPARSPNHPPPLAAASRPRPPPAQGGAPAQGPHGPGPAKTRKHLLARHAEEGALVREAHRQLAPPLPVRRVGQVAPRRQPARVRDARDLRPAGAGVRAWVRACVYVCVCVRARACACG